MTNMLPVPALTKREEFLANLRGGGKYRYRRYKNLPLRYAGGKSLAVGYIVEQIPDYVEQMVSPFIGGGSVEIACANELGIKVQGYDLFDILTNYWQVQLNEPEKLAGRISQWEPTDKVYRELKEVVKSALERRRIHIRPAGVGGVLLV